jgi:hypothetical protein
VVQVRKGGNGQSQLLKVAQTAERFGELEEGTASNFLSTALVDLYSRILKVRCLSSVNLPANRISRLSSVRL